MKWIMGIASAIMMATSFSSQAQAQKVLVLYYSQTSNTKAVAECIAQKLNADIEAIEAVIPYDGDYQATIDRSRHEREAGITPEIKPLKADITKYDVIFLGYPIWYGTYAPPIATFLNNADLSGKRVVPFCTFGSGGLESSSRILASKQPGANVVEGYGVRAARLDAMPQEVENFLVHSGFLEGSYTAPEPFPVQHVVSAEEAAIFDDAVGDYPMINARAMTVASRTIPNGVEYLFTASEKRRNNDPNLQSRPPVEMHVYVIVVNGEAPVFTRVVR
jgi:flavodoxin